MLQYRLERFIEKQTFPYVDHNSVRSIVRVYLHRRRRQQLTLGFGAEILKRAIEARGKTKSKNWPRYGSVACSQRLGGREFTQRRSDKRILSETKYRLEVFFIFDTLYFIIFLTLFRLVNINIMDSKGKAANYSGVNCNGAHCCYKILLNTLKKYLLGYL